MAIKLRDLRGRVSAALTFSFLPLVLLLAGCGGGGGGVGIAEGQVPDPVLVEVPIAYIKRPLPMDDMGGLEPIQADELLTFDVGADLYLRDRASPTASEINITAAETQGMGDVRDVDVSWDGTKIVFAMRGPFDPNLDDEDQPPWNIWEYDIPNASLRRVMVSDIVADAGHDIGPAYLPDGRIMFASTRQRTSGAILLDEGKPQFSAMDEEQNEMAFVLHVMNEDGSNIRQITYNQSHDFNPTVMSDGKIVFSRWDAAGPNSAIHLYRANPDGSGQEMLYGRNSHLTGTNGAEIHFLRPREMANGLLLTVIHQLTAPLRGGDLASIDTGIYLENTQPNSGNPGMTGPAQIRPVVNDVHTDGTISPGGLFASAYPLWDGTGRMLVSWSQCAIQEGANTVPCTPARLADPTSVPAMPAYGIWVYDVAQGTQVPIVAPEAGFAYTDVVAAQARSLPPIILDTELTGDTNLIAENAGVINIRSVYDLDGVDSAVPDIPTLADPVATTPDMRPARFVRVVKAVSLPDEDIVDLDNTAFGRSDVNGMREIIGYAPVEPDGSVRVKVPANVALQVSVLDVQGRRIGPRHNSWIQLRPGEVLNCTGCHDPNTGLSHGRSDAFASAYPGALTTGQPFPNTDPAIFADFGETMAEARGRISCATDCAAITPSVDVRYEDVWTDPNIQTPATPFTYEYATMTTPHPVSAACQGETLGLSNWSTLCRTLINYEMHLQPLWDLPRLAPDGVTDVTCVLCHRRVDDMGNPMVPEGQLELTGGPDPNVMEHVVSYRELMFTDEALEFDPVQGILVPILVQVGVDPVTGDPIFDTVPVPPSMSTAGARASGRFLDRFDPGGTHEAWLTEAELRLISEWLDVGGQYFNNPFDVPIN